MSLDDLSDEVLAWDVLPFLPAAEAARFARTSRRAALVLRQPQSWDALARPLRRKLRVCEPDPAASALPGPDSLLTGSWSTAATPTLEVAEEGVGEGAGEGSAVALPEMDAAVRQLVQEVKANAMVASLRRVRWLRKQDAPPPPPSAVPPSGADDVGGGVDDGAAAHDAAADSGEGGGAGGAEEGGPVALPAEPESPGAREGCHCAIVGSLMVITAGFASHGPTLRNDVYALDMDSLKRVGSDSISDSSVAPHTALMRWFCVPLASEGAPRPRYGHSLTAVPADGPHSLGCGVAVLFGGHAAGSYSFELPDWYVLRLNQEGTASGGITHEWLSPRRLREAGSPKDVSTDVSVFGDDPVIEEPTARGYHTLEYVAWCGRLYAFGGFNDNSECANLEYLSVYDWKWRRPVVTGPAAPGRFGHSCTAVGERLFVIGGSTGWNLVRSGEDHHDVHVFNTRSSTWEGSVREGWPAELGRCHSAAAVGSNILCFGGHVELSNQLSVFNTESMAWQQVHASGEPPSGRLNAVSGVSATSRKFVVYGGWDGRPLGDVSVLDLAPTPDDTSTFAVLPGDNSAEREREEQEMRRDLLLRRMFIQQMLGAAEAREAAGSDGDEDEEDGGTPAIPAALLRMFGFATGPFDNSDDVSDDSDDDGSDS